MKGGEVRARQRLRGKAAVEQRLRRPQVLACAGQNQLELAVHATRTPSSSTCVSRGAGLARSSPSLTEICLITVLLRTE